MLLALKLIEPSHYESTDVDTKVIICLSLRTAFLSCLVSVSDHLSDEIGIEGY